MNYTRIIAPLETSRLANVALLITRVTSEFLSRVENIRGKKRSSVDLRRSTISGNTLSSVACRKSRDHIHHGYCSRYERDNDRWLDIARR